MKDTLKVKYGQAVIFDYKDGKYVAKIKRGRRTNKHKEMLKLYEQQQKNKGKDNA